MISANNIHLGFGGDALLQGVDLNTQEGECLAIVGPNGCGKSTFLKVLAGIIEPDKGEVRLPNRASVGYLPQESDMDVDHSLQTELLEAFDEVLKAMDEMRELEVLMGETAPDSPEQKRVMNRYIRCTHLVERQDGYQLEMRIRRVASGLGFAPEDLERSCREFSGGWQMRILLAKLLLRMPDVLLLDEPTNHLDLETTLWLESWIKASGRTVLLVSHERATMDRLASRIICLSSGKAEIYPGDYSKYLQQSVDKRHAQWAAYERQKREIESIEGFIRRFRATASRAALVQSRIKQLDKIERLTPPFHPTAIHFDFPAAKPSYREVLTLNGVGQSYGDLNVFSGIDLTIFKGEKVGLVGVNGAGKSTLLRILAGREAPAQGSCELGGKVQSVYFAQYDATSLESETSLLDAIREGAPTGEAGRARDLLGAFLFSGKSVDKPLRVLSGGERTRFRLAQILFSPANLLLLDEPTNHLDVTSRATVEEALRAFTGTVVVVSHDRVFMERVTDRIIEIKDGQMITYPGSYGDYLEHKERQASEEPLDPAEEGHSPQNAPKPATPSPPSTSRSTRAAAPEPTLSPKEQRRLEREERKAQERLLRSTKSKVLKIEAEIERIESRMGEIDLAMSDRATATDFGRLAPLTQERRDLEALLHQALTDWEVQDEILEGFKTTL